MEDYNYKRIADAIQYITTNFKAQPSLTQVAESVHLSPYHFQRLFTEWAGVSPKKFMQYLSVNYAKELLANQRQTLFEATHKTGLSSTSRLHDLFVKIEGMTPGEFKSGGRNLKINYHFTDTPFGKVLVASTNKGVCHLAFCETEATGFQALQNRFPEAVLNNQEDYFQSTALSIFRADWNEQEQIKLHLYGTAFQLKVWEALLQIPMGKLTTYGSIAGAIDKPNASRAVGTAIGNNPIAFIIPCHRVIQASGKVGGYMWGPVRKQAIIGWEAVRAHNQ